MNTHYLDNRRPEILEFLPAGFSRVLEIGCSDGSFAVQLPADVEYWAVDPALKNDGSSKRRFTRAFGETFEECLPRLPTGYFDLVICNDVIEHMADHDRFLRDVRPLMSAGGCLVGSVPNVGHIGVLYRLLVQRDWRYQEQGILDRTHLRFFTRKSLGRSLREAGFEVCALEGINSELVRGGMARRALLALAIGLSAGLLRDARFIQFGFRARS